MIKAFPNHCLHGCLSDGREHTGCGWSVKALEFILSEHTLQTGAHAHASKSRKLKQEGRHEHNVSLGTRARFCFNTLHHACTHLH